MIVDLLFAMMGLSVLVGIAFAFSDNKSQINWRQVVMGISLQLVFAFFIILTPWGETIFNYFAKFFVNELKKNRTKNKRHTRKIYTKEIDCFNYSNRLYKRCRFYWHKRTSKHNRKLCSAAQLLKNDKEKNKGKKLPKGKKFTGGV